MGSRETKMGSRKRSNKKGKKMEHKQGFGKQTYVHVLDSDMAFFGFTNACYLSLIARTIEFSNKKGYVRIPKSFLCDRLSISSTTSKRKDSDFIRLGLIDRKVFKPNMVSETHMKFNSKGINRLIHLRNCYYALSNKIGFSEVVDLGEIPSLNVLVMDKLEEIVFSRLEDFGIKQPEKIEIGDNNKPIIEDKKTILAKKIITEWNEMVKDIPSMPSKKDGKKIVDKIKARLKTYSEVDFYKCFSVGLKNKVLVKDTWFKLDYIVRSDDTFEKVISGVFDFKMDSEKPNNNKTSKFGEKSIDSQLEESRKLFGELWYFNNLNEEDQQEYIKEYGGEPSE